MLLSVNAGSCYPSSQRSVLFEWGAGALWILSWEWVSPHLHDCLLWSLQLGLPHCALNTEETALNIAFLLLHGGRSADKIRARLEGQWERNFHSGACRYLRAPQCYAHCLNPAGKEKTSMTMQRAKEGKFIADSNQGPCYNQRSGAKSESPGPQFPHTFIVCSISNISNG